MPFPPGALTSRPGRRLVVVLFLSLAVPAAARLPLVDPLVEGWRAGDPRLLACDPATGWPDSLDVPPRWQPLWSAALAELAAREKTRDDTLLAWRVAAALGETLRFDRPGGDAPPLPNLPGFRNPDDPGPPDDPDTPVYRLAAAWRRARDGERAGRPLPWPALWRAVLALPPADRRTGWQLWRSLRAAHGLGAAPGDSLDDAAARWVASLPPGSVTWRELDGWHLPPDAAAGLGAAQLRGAPLRRHLAEHPRPPRSLAWQQPWILGRWRAARHAREVARRLAARPDLHPLARADLLRRRCDLALSRGDTAGVVEDLSRAVALVRHRTGRTARLVAAMVERAAVLARHRGWRRLGVELARLAARTGPAVAAGGDTTRDLILGGSLPACLPEAGGGAHRLPRPAPAVRLAAWRRWGRRLGRQGRLPARDRRLLASLDLAHPRRSLVRLATAVPRDLRVAVLTAAVLHDLYRLAPAAPRRRSPLLLPARRGGDDAVRRRYLLLGLALLLDDTATQLAAAVRLPAAGLPVADRRLLTHPVPRHPALRAALTATPVDPCLLLAVARNESALDPAARSGAGALGWMQVMPSLHPDGAWDPREGPRWQNPLRAVTVGASLLATACRRRRGDAVRVVAEYNAGPGAVDRWLRQLGGDPTPAILAGWIGFPETRRYTREVLIDRQQYRWLLGQR